MYINNSLEKEVELCKKYEKELKDYLERLQYLLLKKEINPSEYNAILDGKIEGKNLHEWLDFYRRKVILYNSRLKKRKQILSASKALLFFGLFVFLIIFCSFVFDNLLDIGQGVLFAPDPLISVILNSTDNPLNATESNLTAYVIPLENLTQKNIYNWYLNNESLLLVNLPFDGGSSGISSKDYSSFGNNAKVVNAFFNSTGGADGFGAYELVKDNEHINISTNGLDNVNEITVSVWYKRRAGIPITGDLEMIMDRDYLINGSERSSLFLFNRSGHLKLEWTFGKSAVSDASGPLEGYIDDGNWHHIAVTKNAGGTGEYYVDGVFNGTEISGIRNGTMYNDGREIILGVRASDLGAHWVNGSLDDFRIYGRSLSPQEILAIYEGRDDLILSQETSIGDYWHVQVTPNDGVGDGIPFNSSGLIVLPPYFPINLFLVEDSPINGKNVSGSENFNVTIDASRPLSNFNITLDGSVSVFLNSSLVLASNFDNLVDLGETPGSFYIDGSFHNYAPGSFGGSCRMAFNVTASWQECPSTVTGHYFGAMDFENTGSSDYIDYGSPTTIDFGNNGPFTVMGWIKPESLTSTQKIFSKSAFQQSAISWSVGTATNGWMYFITSGGTYTNSVQVFDVGQWTHATLVYNGTSVIYYADGQRKGTPDSASYADDVTHNFYIGGGNHATDENNFDGIVDEVKLFNVALTDEEIDREFRLQMSKINSTRWSVRLKDEPMTVKFPGDISYRSCAQDVGSIDCEGRNVSVQICTFNGDYTISSNLNCPVINVTNGATLTISNGVTLNSTAFYIEKNSLLSSPATKFTINSTNLTIISSNISANTFKGNIKRMILDSSSIRGNVILSVEENLTMDSTSGFNADFYGFAGGGPSGQGSGTGGGDFVPGAGTTGGGHGAYGAIGSGGGKAGRPYGSSLAPVTYGSGGGGGLGVGGNGGGRIQLNIGDTLDFDGDISVNGERGDTGLVESSGGAGGSIWATTYRLDGNGRFLADGGGRGGSQAGDGAGGRIAVYYNTTNWVYGNYSRSSANRATAGFGGVGAKYGSLLFGSMVNGQSFIYEGFRFQGLNGLNAETTNITNIYNTSNEGVFNLGNLTTYEVGALTLGDQVINTSSVKIIGNKINLSQVNFTYEISTTPKIEIDYSGALIGEVSAFQNNFKLSLENTGNVRIDWIPTLSGISNLALNTNLSLNRTFVNSTALSGLNVSANLTFWGLAFADSWAIYDPEDDGTFITCPGNVCANISVSLGNLKFNVTGFTTYSAKSVNAPPKIFFVSEILNIAPTEATYTNLNFSFLVSDPEGVYSLDDSSLHAEVSKVGETPRSNLTCFRMPDVNFSAANYSCIVTMWYFDGAGEWNINLTINDSEGKMAVNDTISFNYQLLTAIVLSNKLITFPPTNPGSVDLASNSDPIFVNNTGNAEGSLNINAIDLYGESDSSFTIPAANFSVHATSGSECTGTALVNGTSANIPSTNLYKGNLSLGGGVAQETIYYCIIQVPINIPSQPYSSSQGGSWIISLMVLVVFSGKKNKKFFEDELVKVIKILSKGKEISFPLSNKDPLSILVGKVSKKYGLSKTKVFELVTRKKITGIPFSIFCNDLGALESLVKYMKENLGLTYREISRDLKRDERTIWNVYKNSLEKHTSPFDLLRTEKNILPLDIFRNKELTVLEAAVVFLKSKNIKNIEIAKMLKRDQRNIWKTYYNAKKKMGNIKV